MILAALLLAAHCADPAFCPARAELKRAVLTRQNDGLWDMMQAASEKDADELVLMTPRRITRVSGIYCDEPSEGMPKSVTCRITLHYGRDKSYQIIRVVREKDEWVVREGLAVFRRSRP